MTKNDKIAAKALQDAVEAAGSQNQLAIKVGIERASVQLWMRKQRVPYERIVTVEKVTGVPRERLAPELFAGVTLQRAA